jgi:hypothetical protein
MYLFIVVGTVYLFATDTAKNRGRDGAFGDRWVGVVHCQRPLPSPAVTAQAATGTDNGGQGKRHWEDGNERSWGDEEEMAFSSAPSVHPSH